MTRGVVELLRELLTVATAEGRWALVQDVAKHLAQLEQAPRVDIGEHDEIGDTTNQSTLKFIVGGKQLA